MSVRSSSSSEPQDRPLSRSRRLAPLAAAAALSAGLLAASPAEAQPLVYYGGRVISNVEVVQVPWTSAVDPMLLNDLTTFYKTLLASDYLDWLTEYDTIGKPGFVDKMPGSEQHIGRGTFFGTVPITPQNPKKTLADKDIQVELAAQLDKGVLPPPKLDAQGNVNSLYVFEFPDGYSIDLFGLQSCQQYGGYHFTIKYKGLSVPYAVIPGCGFNMAQHTLVRSHELVEAITDTEPGLLADVYAPTNRPVAWVAQADNFWDAPEASDICGNNPEVVENYTVTTSWSNFANDCVARIPLCDGSSSPPSCRPCNAFDEGVGCNGTTPACETAGMMAGQCVTCTAKSPGACTGATPVCNPENHTCVGCLKDGDCAASKSTPVCDLGTMTCRGCQKDAECKTGHCDAGSDAEKGQCVACNTDPDCPADHHCDAHACVENSMGTGAGGGDTGGTGGDGGTGGTGGSGTGGSGFTLNKGGCSCRAGAGEAPDGGWAALLVLALTGTWRCSRRARPAGSCRRRP